MEGLKVSRQTIIHTEEVLAIQGAKMVPITILSKEILDLVDFIYKADQTCSVTFARDLVTPRIGATSYTDIHQAQGL